MELVVLIILFLWRVFLKMCHLRAIESLYVKLFTRGDYDSHLAVDIRIIPNKDDKIYLHFHNFNQWRGQWRVLMQLIILSKQISRINKISIIRNFLTIFHFNQGCNKMKKQGEFRLQWNLAMKKSWKWTIMNCCLCWSLMIPLLPKWRKRSKSKM